MLLEFLLGNLWHPKHKAWEDKDWPVERGIETGEQKCFWSPQSWLVINCIGNYRGLEVSIIDWDEFGTDHMGNLVAKIRWTTGRRDWHHEARLWFSCLPRDVMKLDISLDDGPKKCYSRIRSAGRMLQILYYEPRHRLRELPNKASLNFEILILNLNLKFE
jgi:hypothetical protein